MTVERGKVRLARDDVFAERNRPLRLVIIQMPVGRAVDVIVPDPTADIVQHNTLKTMVKPHRPSALLLTCKRWHDHFRQFQIPRDRVRVFCIIVKQVLLFHTRPDNPKSTNRQPARTLAQTYLSATFLSIQHRRIPMSDGFTQMIDDGNAFFAELAQNNTKDWFNPRKDHYVENIRKPAEFFADLLADDFSRIAGRAMKPKVFRIYRDVRFSKDKTPLNAHLHILWSPVGDNSFAPAFFFASSPADLSVGFGMPVLKGAALTRFRAFIDVWGDQLVDAVDKTGMTYSNWGAAPLKRVPKPYDPDHPHADLLRKKGLILGAPLGQDWREAEGGLVTAVRAKFEGTEPLRRLFDEKLSGDA